VESPVFQAESPASGTPRCYFYDTTLVLRTHYLLPLFLHFNSLLLIHFVLNYTCCPCCAHSRSPGDSRWEGAGDSATKADWPMAVNSRIEFRQYIRCVKLILRYYRTQPCAAWCLRHRRCLKFLLCKSFCSLTFSYFSLSSITLLF